MDKRRRSRTRIRAAKLICVCALIAGPACTNYRIVKDDKINERAMRRVERRTEQARGLPFLGPVDAEVYTQEKSGSYFEKRIGSDSDERVRIDDLVAHRLGVLPDGLSLKDLFSQALTKNAAGVYLPDDDDGDTPPIDGSPPEPVPPRRGRLFIVEDALPQPARSMMTGFGYVTGTDWSNELFMSHELMHALQDQYFDLDRLIPRRLYGTNEDMALARKSIVESEANLVAQAYLLGVDLDSYVQRNGLIGYLRLGRQLDVWATQFMTPELPLFYVKLFVEQYSQGMRFLQAATNLGGWGAVNNAYRQALPQSTEQLMWPEKFFGDEKDPPKFLPPLTHPVIGADNADAAAAKPALTGPLAGYAHLESNVFGAMLWRILLEEAIDSGRARDVVHGWGGDRYDVVERDDRAMLLWRTLWDTPEDAEEFHTAYAQLLAKKYPGRLTKQSDGDVVVFSVAPKEGDDSGPGVRTALEEIAVVARDQARVVVIEGAAPGKWKALLAHLWDHTVDDDEAAPALPPLRITAEPPDRFLKPEANAVRPRVHLPHHTIAMRFGAGLQLHHDVGPVPVPQLLLDREFRWGFRQNLEWTPPFVFALRVPTLPGSRASTILSGGLVDVRFELDDVGRWGLGVHPALAMTEVFDLGRWLGAFGQARADAFLSTLPSSSQPVLWNAGGGVVLTPHNRIVIHGGIGVQSWTPLAELAGNKPPAFTNTEVVVGSTLFRGGAFQPTVEFRLIDQLYIYELSQAFISVGSLDLRAHRHVVGVLLYF